MSMERWSPFREFDRVQSWMDRFLDENMRGVTGPHDRLNPEMFSPAIDLIEHDKEYELHLAVPGFKPEEIQVDINQDMVTVRGEMKAQERQEKKGNYVYRERHASSFYRQVRLPQAVESGKAEAQLKDGLLKLTMPKAAQATVHHLEVKTAK